MQPQKGNAIQSFCCTATMFSSSNNSSIVIKNLRRSFMAHKNGMYKVSRLRIHGSFYKYDGSSFFFCEYSMTTIIIKDDIREKKRCVITAAVGKRVLKTLKMLTFSYFLHFFFFFS